MTMERKSFLLRLDPATIETLHAWATDDLRSPNGQIEFLLRRALREAGRLPSTGGTRPGSQIAPSRQTGTLRHANARRLHRRTDEH
jgi:hypothetical protein